MNNEPYVFDANNPYTYRVWVPKEIRFYGGRLQQRWYPYIHASIGLIDATPGPEWRYVPFVQEQTT